MGRKRKNFSKKYIYDNFYLTFDVYKDKVAFFKIRFNYESKDDTKQNIEKLKMETETLFKKEFEYLERSRHILEVEMVDEMRNKTARCSLNGYFLKFDDYEEFIIAHADKLMEKVEVLFEKDNLKLKLPKGQNNRTKTY